MCFLSSTFFFFPLTCNTDAYPEGVHEKGRQLPNSHVMTSHEEPSFVQHWQDHDVSTQTCLKIEICTICYFCLKKKFKQPSQKQTCLYLFTFTGILNSYLLSCVSQSDFNKEYIEFWKHNLWTIIIEFCWILRCGRSLKQWIWWREITWDKWVNTEKDKQTKKRTRSKNRLQ